jgi:pepF/M3 family oligoendopeptidase
METTTTTLPRWDLTAVYPGLESPELEAGFQQLDAHLGALEQQAETLEPGTVDDALVALFESFTDDANAMADALFTNFAYISCQVDVDTRNETAQAWASELRQLTARAGKIRTRYDAWLGALDVEQLIARSTVAAEHAYLLRQAKVAATHLMSQPEEDLAAELLISGGIAWSNLSQDVSSQITVRTGHIPGQPEEQPMSEVRNLAMSPGREVRRAAYEAELEAWKLWATPMAAALNGVKGQHVTLASHRHWNEVLDEALFQNHIDRQTLDAMMGAARDAFPDLRRYLRAKAKALGLPVLAFYDLFAPISASERVWPWSDAVAFVTEQFGTFSPRMRAHAERAFREHWVDAEPRPGKVGGAYCTRLIGDQSRVLANYVAAYDGVSTLAHELGHAYHDLCESTATQLQRDDTPMTLAETASTFCEMILRRAALKDASEDEQLSILEAELQDATQTTIDITSRFLFESAVFARRAQRELSADEFCELMLDAQRQTYGDGLDQELLHPYMWAAKSHYYWIDAPFYNFPYMFGLLFSLGLFARYEADPEAFRAHYDELLASTGKADAADLAAWFGIDIRDRAFWESSLDVIRADIDRFVALVEKRELSF